MLIFMPAISVPPSLPASGHPNIPWALWQHRNEVLHASDVDRTMHDIDRRIRAELDAGPMGLNKSAALLFHFNHRTIFS
jgi:hypothetical protein